MTAIVLSKDTNNNQPYRYTGIVAMITTKYQIKLIGRTNRIINLDRDLIVNILLEDLTK